MYPLSAFKQTSVSFECFIFVFETEGHISQLLIGALQKWVILVLIDGSNIFINQILQQLNTLHAVPFGVERDSQKAFGAVDQLLALHHALVHHRHLHLLDVLSQRHRCYLSGFGIVHARNSRELLLNQENGGFAFI